MSDNTTLPGKPLSLLDRLICFCLENKLVVFLLVVFAVYGGLRYAPFGWKLGGMPRDPVPVDAIPDIGENQQIVFTPWPGRSPQDVEDQVTYPLTRVLMGLPGVKSIRSTSMLGFSSISVIFDEDTEFYWSRSRILEKLNSLPAGTLPAGAQPALGPDATALGQVFWYTLEGLDDGGNPTGGWDLEELRSVQDWLVRYELLSVDGVSEVGSIGGFQREYQVDADPDAMRAYGVTLDMVFKAVKNSNIDVGARTIEINKVEYVIRGIGFLKNIKDIENTIVASNDGVPVYVKNIARVTAGPALRRGALDKEGAETVGGVVVVRYGANPMEVIKKVREKIAAISPSLKSKTLPDGVVSRVAIVPFYDRTELIEETLGTLHTALSEEILVTVIVVVVSLMHLGSSLLISALLPLAVLLCFVAMKAFGVDANIVALSGIAIAIGTMVDMGIVLTENILKHLQAARPDEKKPDVVFRAAREVGSAVLTAVATTVVGFLPVFTLTAAEGKLFKPLAYTKTFALIASVIVALVVIPPVASILFRRRNRPVGKKRMPWIINAAIVLVVLFVLAGHWLPLGPENGFGLNVLFVAVLLGAFLAFFKVFQHRYGRMLGWCLDHKMLFISIPLIIILLGAAVWTGLDKEFMPPLDEGSFLYMPSTMTHASIGEALDAVQKQDMAIRAIPEVDTVVGKIGRVDSRSSPTSQNTGLIKTANVSCSGAGISAGPTIYGTR